MANDKDVKVLKAHLAINVRDVERSIEFYGKMLGIEPSKVRPGYAKFNVENPPLNLTLNQVPFTDSGALSHLGFQVASTEDVLAVRERWAEAGLATRDEMQTNCCYARQDKTWVQDPDGNEWEVFVVLEDNLTVTTTCCAAAEEVQTSDAAKAEPEPAGACAAPADAAGASCGCVGTVAPAVEAAAASCCATAPVAVSR